MFTFRHSLYATENVTNYFFLENCKNDESQTEQEWSFKQFMCFMFIILIRQCFYSLSACYLHQHEVDIVKWIKAQPWRNPNLLKFTVNLQKQLPVLSLKCLGTGEGSQAQTQTSSVHPQVADRESPFNGGCQVIMWKACLTVDHSG